jgi:hypothetical protein
MQSCYFYKVSTTSYPQIGEISPAIVPSKTFVVHSQSLAFKITDIIAKNDSIFGEYAGYHALPGKKTKFPDLNSNSIYYKRNGGENICNEVHFYLRVPIVPGREITRFAISDIFRYDVYEKNRKLSIIASGLAVTAGVIFLLSDVLHTTGFGN